MCYAHGKLIGKEKKLSTRSLIVHEPEFSSLPWSAVTDKRRLPLIAPTTSDATPRCDPPINLHYSPPFLLFCKHVPMSRADTWAPPFALI